MVEIVTLVWMWNSCLWRQELRSTQRVYRSCLQGVTYSMSQMWHRFSKTGCYFTFDAPGEIIAWICQWLLYRLRDCSWNFWLLRPGVFTDPDCRQFIFGLEKEQLSFIGTCKCFCYFEPSFGLLNDFPPTGSNELDYRLRFEDYSWRL